MNDECRVGKGARQKGVHARLRRAMRTVPTIFDAAAVLVGTARVQAPLYGDRAIGDEAG